MLKILIYVLAANSVINYYSNFLLRLPKSVINFVISFFLIFLIFI